MPEDQDAFTDHDREAFVKPKSSTLEPVTAEPGRPLYLSVRDSLRAAIDRGAFTPGEQMPSTKQLSEQLSVSLVTAHRALQELVASGVLRRSQGKGTFVHDRYLQRREQLSRCRVGLVLHREASIADYYHGQMLEGVRRASAKLGADLILLRFGEDVRNECNGFLYVNPLPDELVDIAATTRRQPTIIVGARVSEGPIGCVDVDNIDLGRRAVEYLASLGHRNILFVGGDEQLSNSRDRRSGFEQGCRQYGIDFNRNIIFNAASWRLTDEERSALCQRLRASDRNHADRPTAIFAAGYYLALDVYSAAQQAGLEIPGDLSVVGVDDPPSASHLSPPLTTVRQPLVELGEEAVAKLVSAIAAGNNNLPIRTLVGELVPRSSARMRV